MHRIGRRVLLSLPRLAGVGRGSRGATSTEYALLLVLIVVVLLVAVRFFGHTVLDLFRTYPELISS